MRPFIPFLILVALLPSAACHKSIAPDTPICIIATIRANKIIPSWRVGEIAEYQFQGKRVYAFSPSKGVVDATTSIKSAECVDMCSVGGFAGAANNKCNGENFFENAAWIRTIWKRE
jgi:hypothetical protein